MKLEDLRAELDTDARKEVTDLRRHLEKTEERLKMKTDECNGLSRQIRDLHCASREPAIVTDEKTAEVIFALSNRCMALSHGTMCCFCTIKEYCQSPVIVKIRALDLLIQTSL